MENENIDSSKRLNDVVTSGKNLSYWLQSVEPIKFKPLDRDLTVDNIVIGGGIAGVTLAYLLSKSKQSVALIDDGYIGSGETGRTTAHLVNALDDRYYDLIKMFGEEKALLAGESHTLAINFIEEVYREENIECDFERVDGYLFLHPSDNETNLGEELDATHRVKIDTIMVNSVPGLFNYIGNAVLFPRQAQFNPLKYIAGLTKVIEREGGLIFTETKAEDIDSTGVKVNGGFKITAKNIAVCTNTPINNTFTMHTKIAPYRTYVTGYKVAKGALPHALWWDTGDKDSPWPTDPYHYVRMQTLDDNSDLLIVGGEDHKTAQEEKDNFSEADRYKRLEEWTRNYFPQAKEMIYQWSGQVMEPVDSLAYIGRNPGDDNIYICTGDSGNGMTHGTIAGMMICDLILGKSNRYQDLYDPSRKTLSSADVYVKEQANVAKQFGDYLSRSDYDSIDEIPNGSGGTLRNNLSKMAVFKDDNGVVYKFSAVCPHLKCLVQWNNDEKSFDCPCHGSRFTCYGKVVNGPAISDLDKIED